MFANILTNILGESSPLPAEFEEELIQLHDLIGDIFSDNGKSLDEAIPDVVNLVKFFQYSNFYKRGVF